MDAVTAVRLAAGGDAELFPSGGKFGSWLADITPVTVGAYRNQAAS
jgi:hypothetical protein